jgi:dynein heavy chain
MNEDQFSNLQILAIHYEWFQDMFDRMPRDGRETQWRNLCESEQPETQPLPDRMDEQYTLLQRMLVVRAVRSDRLNQLSALFINQTLDKK